jgi:uroporphyrinogen decarboxylase
MHACLGGEKTDHTPIALWRHFPVDDQTPGTLAKATLFWQKEYDFDFVKVTPASSFCLKDWGVDDKWEGNIEGTRGYTKRVINKPDNWLTLSELEPTSSHLYDQVNCLQMIKQQLDPGTPIVQTIFSPLAQAKNLAGNENLILHLRKYPEAVLKGLEVITRTTIRYLDSLHAIGIDGIFYAVQHAQATLLTRDEYQRFGLPFDERIGSVLGEFWLNLLHVHGRNIYFSLFPHLPFSVINWHDRDTGPGLSDARGNFSGVICGGLKQDTLAYMSPSDILQESREAIQSAGSQRFILSTGCVVPVITPHGNLVAARESVNK